jgi:hypothetical protein
MPIMMLRTLSWCGLGNEPTTRARPYLAPMLVLTARLGVLWGADFITACDRFEHIAQAAFDLTQEMRHEMRRRLEMQAVHEATGVSIEGRRSRSHQEQATVYPLLSRVLETKCVAQRTLGAH